MVDDGAIPTVSIEDGGEPTRRLGERHRLLIWRGGEAWSCLLPRMGEVIVGRAKENDVHLDLLSVSRRHARLRIRPGEVLISDLGSHNGTFVNGERIGSNERLLVYGDSLLFGDVRAIFEDEVGEPAPSMARALSQPKLLEIGDRTVLIADPAMAQIYTELSRLARTDLTVLVLGETGTGKDLASAALHFWSRRASGPFVTINSAALPENLVESELLGHERGAFSGAVSAKLGMLEAADGGTLFLDEIGDLPLGTQAKLLRVLETGRFVRLGSVRERKVDVRICAATNRDLAQGIRAGWFREDLYHRLTVALVKLPPLRMRPAEVLLLARHFADASCEKLGRPPLELPDAVLDRLAAHSWPGNVRELKNVMDYLSASVTGKIVRVDQLPSRLMPERTEEPPTATSPLAQPLATRSREFERENLASALASTKGNRTHAARLLGMPLRTFMDKIKRYGVR